MLAKTATAPLARVTILLQTKTLTMPVVLRRPEFVLTGEMHHYYSYRAPASVDRPSLVEAMGAVVRTDGVRGLWRGNLASCIHRFPYSGVTFLVHSHLKQTRDINDFAAGAIAGSVAAAVAYPLDLVKTRMATDRKYLSVLHTLKYVVEEEGVAALYRGLLPTLAHVAPSFAISFGVYGFTKNLLLEVGDEVGGSSKSHARVSGTQALVSGSASGFASAVLLYPVDLVRRKLQLKQGNSVRECIESIWARDGLKGFYRGLPAELAKVVPYVGALFFAVEAIKANI